MIKTPYLLAASTLCQGTGVIKFHPLPRNPTRRGEQKTPPQKRPRWKSPCNFIATHDQFPPSCPYLVKEEDRETQESMPIGEHRETTQLATDNLVQKQDNLVSPTKAPVSQEYPTTSKPLGKHVADEWIYFIAYTVKNPIWPFRKDKVPRLDEQASTNVDITLSHYESSPYTYMGKQRRGDFVPIKDADNNLGRAKNAIGLELFLARQIPLPEETQEANKFPTSAPPESIIASWNKQLARLDTTIAQSATIQEEWKQQTPDSISRVTGELKTGAIAQLLNRYNMGG